MEMYSNIVLQNSDLVIYFSDYLNDKDSFYLFTSNKCIYNILLNNKNKQKSLKDYIYLKCQVYIEV